jgi:hypothetical protein
MFFLGAGASVGGGIPTAAEMVWMFKRDIYCSETGTSPEAFRDLTVARTQDYLPIGLYLLLSDPTFAHLCLRLKSSADPAH